MVATYAFDLAQFCAFLGEKLGSIWKIVKIAQNSIKKLSLKNEVFYGMIYSIQENKYT